MQSALERFYQHVAPWLDVRANDQFLLEAAGENPQLETLVEIAKRLPGLSTNDNYTGFPLSATQAGRQLAMDTTLPKALAMERQELIAEITQGRSTFSLTTGYGNRKVYDSSTGFELQFSSAGGRRKVVGNAWEGLSQAQVRELHAKVMEERRLKNMSRSELRKEIAPHRGKPLAPSTKPVETSDGYRLINPSTGIEFNKHELLEFLHDKGNATKILVHPSSRTLIPEAFARMKEILGVSR